MNLPAFVATKQQGHWNSYALQELPLHCILMEVLEHNLFM
jgi:hypothetical protein